MNIRLSVRYVFNNFGAVHFCQTAFFLWHYIPLVLSVKYSKSLTSDMYLILSHIKRPQLTPNFKLSLTLIKWLLRLKLYSVILYGNG